jgi:hypothetical protein
MAEERGVYVLQLRRPGGFYYVGSSESVSARVNSHVLAPSQKFVSDNGGVDRVLAPLSSPDSNLLMWEMKETMTRMIAHGFNNVRGWEFVSNRPLSTTDLDAIYKIICGTFGSSGLCRICGFPGHMAAQCVPNVERAAWLQNLHDCRTEAARVAPPPQRGVDKATLELITNGSLPPEVQLFSSEALLYIPNFVVEKLEEVDEAPLNSAALITTAFAQAAGVPVTQAHSYLRSRLRLSTKGAFLSPASGAPLVLKPPPALSADASLPPSVPPPPLPQKKRKALEANLDELEFKGWADSSSAAPAKGGCSRCGRVCHTKERCYARTYGNGETIADR